MLNGYININLEEIDFFHNQLPLTFKKEYFHNTTLGGALTILNIILILILLFLSIGDLSNGSNFTVFSNESELLNSEISFSNIPMVLNVDKYYNITAYYELKNIELINCKKLISYNKYYNDLKNFKDFANFQCISPEINIKLKEKYKDGLKILIRKDNSDINNIDVISDLNILFFNYNLNHSEKSINKIINPKITTKTINLSSINTKFKKIYYFVFEQGNYFLYNNIFINTKNQNIKFHLYKGYEYEYEMNDSDESIIAEINFISNNLLISYYKKFINFWDTLAKIGGILHIILLISKKFSDYISKKIFYLEIYNYFSTQRDIYTDYYNKLNNIFYNYNTLNSNNNTINNINNINITRYKKQKTELKEFDNSNFVLMKNSSFLPPNNKNYDNKGNTMNDEPSLLNKRSIKPPAIVYQSKLSNRVKENFVGWEEKNIPKYMKILFYLCPDCLISKISSFKELVRIINNVSNVFSFENMFKLVVLEKSIIERGNISRTFKINRINK